LREKGLVAVRRGERDERMVEARLTGEGERALREHVGLDTERLGEALAAMSEEVREAVRSAFGALAERLRAGSLAGER
jgi:DNA-binding MarR family transcriptional regulator